MNTSATPSRASSRMRTLTCFLSPASANIAPQIAAPPRRPSAPTACGNSALGTHSRQWTRLSPSWRSSADCVQYVDGRCGEDAHGDATSGRIDLAYHLGRPLTTSNYLVSREVCLPGMASELSRFASRAPMRSRGTCGAPSFAEIESSWPEHNVTPCQWRGQYLTRAGLDMARRKNRRVEMQTPARDRITCTDGIPIKIQDASVR